MFIKTADLNHPIDFKFDPVYFENRPMDSGLIKEVYPARGMPRLLNSVGQYLAREHAVG